MAYKFFCCKLSFSTTWFQLQLHTDIITVIAITFAFIANAIMKKSVHKNTYDSYVDSKCIVDKYNTFLTLESLMN